MHFASFRNPDSFYSEPLPLRNIANKEDHSPSYRFLTLHKYKMGVLKRIQNSQDFLSSLRSSERHILVGQRHQSAVIPDQRPRSLAGSPSGTSNCATQKSPGFAVARSHQSTSLFICQWAKPYDIYLKTDVIRPTYRSKRQHAEFFFKRFLCSFAQLGN
jgi:hypothetical protein